MTKGFAAGRDTAERAARRPSGPRANAGPRPVTDRIRRESVGVVSRAMRFAWQAVLRDGVEIRIVVEKERACEFRYAERLILGRQAGSLRPLKCGETLGGEWRGVNHVALNFHRVVALVQGTPEK